MMTSACLRHKREQFRWELQMCCWQRKTPPQNRNKLQTACDKNMIILIHFSRREAGKAGFIARSSHFYWLGIHFKTLLWNLLSEKQQIVTTLREQIFQLLSSRSFLEFFLFIMSTKPNQMVSPQEASIHPLAEKQLRSGIVKTRDYVKWSLFMTSFIAVSFTWPRGKIRKQFRCNAITTPSSARQKHSNCPTFYSKYTRFLSKFCSTCPFTMRFQQQHWIRLGHMTNGYSGVTKLSLGRRNAH